MEHKSREKRLTVDDIDPELVEKIRLSDDFTETTDPTSSPHQNREYILAVLLHLAENPIIPTKEQSDVLQNFWVHFETKRFEYPNDFATQLAMKWQQIMLLRRSDPLPDELKALLFGVGYEANRRIIAAWKLGTKKEAASG